MTTIAADKLSTLEQKNCYLAKVEVDEVTSLMCDVAAEIPPNNAMPGWVVLLVEFLLDECSNVLSEINKNRNEVIKNLIIPQHAYGIITAKCKPNL